MSSRDLSLSNYGPMGKLRNVKAMGLPKLEAIADHPDADPILRRRVIRQLQVKYGVERRPLTDPVRNAEAAIAVAGADPATAIAASLAGSAGEPTEHHYRVAQERYEAEAAQRLGWPPWESVAADQKLLLAESVRDDG